MRSGFFAFGRRNSGCGTMELMPDTSKPLLFLDVDLTLFDTSEFYEWLGPDAESRADLVADIVTERIPSPDFHAMLYPDTEAFLVRAREHYRIVILTFSLNTKLQQKKISGSGIVPYVDGIIMTQGEKGEEIARYLDVHAAARDAGHAFIDDSPHHIANAKAVVPEVFAVRIERVLPDADETKEAATGDGDLVIHTLDEFPLDRATRG